MTHTAISSINCECRPASPNTTNYRGPYHTNQAGVFFCPLHAAAPDLLTALEEIMNVRGAEPGEWEPYSPATGKMKRSAEQAIAKARGEEE